MEKLIKVKATMFDGREREFRTTSFEVKPLRDGKGLCVKVTANYSVTCRSITVEQKETDFMGEETHHVGSEGLERVGSPR